MAMEINYKITLSFLSTGVKNRKRLLAASKKPHAMAKRRRRRRSEITAHTKTHTHTHIVYHPCLP